MNKYLRYGLFAFFAGTILSFVALKWRASKQTLPDYGELPSFELMTSSKQAYSKDQLLGKWTVFNFFFTHCPTQCPMVNGRVKALANGFKGENKVQFVSITVDPERDTPDVLLMYATKMNAPENWRFLTGEKPEVDTLLLKGFRLATEGVGDGTVHSFKLVLVDPQAKIRSFYDGLDELSVSKLKMDLNRVLSGTLVSLK